MSLGPNFRKLFAATTVSNLGDGVSLIAAPWLVSATLPAGVITDRHDRRGLMMRANAARFALTLVLTGAVALSSGSLPGPSEVDSVVGTRLGLYVVVVTITLLIGFGEVLYDNSAQTFLPSIVPADDLEVANGRTYTAELIATSSPARPSGRCCSGSGLRCRSSSMPPR